MISFLWLINNELLFGYGERPARIAFAAAIVIFLFALMHFVFPLSELSADLGAIWSRVWHSFYFSVVSFSTLGYGGWIETPHTWVAYLGGLESFVGLFITAMFLVTFSRKWTR